MRVTQTFLVFDSFESFEEYWSDHLHWDYLTFHNDSTEIMDFRVEECRRKMLFSSYPFKSVCYQNKASLLFLILATWCSLGSSIVNVLIFSPLFHTLLRSHYTHPTHEGWGVMPYLFEGRVSI